MYLAGNRGTLGYLPWSSLPHLFQQYQLGEDDFRIPNKDNLYFVISGKNIAP